MAKPPFLLGFHRWLALAFAPLLLLQAMTGAALLFRDELTALAIPAKTRTDGHPPLSELVAAARNAEPGLRLTRLFFPVDDDSAAFAQLEGANGAMRYAAIDPADGEVISSGTVWRYPFEAALQVHYKLMAGWVGLLVVSLNGLALAVLAMSGLWQWWPGAGRLTRDLAAPSRAPSRLRLRMWHRSLGAVVALVLMTSATTGILLSAPNLPIFAAPAAPVARPVVIGAQDLDRAFSLAQESYPGAQPRDLRFAPDGTLSFNFFAPRGGKWAVDVVTVSTGGQQVAAKLPLEQNPALWLTMLPIHTGDLIGPAGRWPMLAAALALIFLTISGPLMWWRARTKRRQA